MSNLWAEKILRSRKGLAEDLPAPRRAEEAAEGGCGVLGFASNIPVAGRHVLAASAQMHNRGNGKGGGIAMVGLDPIQVGCSPQTLRGHTLLQVALLDPPVQRELEADFIEPYYEIAHAYALPHLDDHRAVPGLEVRPPDVWRYFVRPKPDALAAFTERMGLADLPQRALEDEYVYQNSYALNRKLYAGFQHASLGEKRAFVLSHGRNLSVLKIVGYAEEVVSYYCLEDQTAQVWIAHQRYPTKGRVWHPGGAHPFIGVNEALVHNGDFANYHAVGEYLRQRNIGQLFLTDTEVGVQLFDLWDRVYGYPLEITLEAMAPTTEHDFAMLPAEKQSLYQAVQRAHIHGSPDGPWFFIVARSQADEKADRFELLGITDTSMLRPQVFALYENRGSRAGSLGLDDKFQSPTPSSQPPVQIGLIASERQAINACLRSLAAEDERFQPVADQYWVARGGSHTDGGAFRFTVQGNSAGPGCGYRLECADKFGRPVMLHSAAQEHVFLSDLDPQQAPEAFRQNWEEQAYYACDDGGAPTFYRWLQPRLPDTTWDELAWGLDWLVGFGRQGDVEWEFSRQTLTLLRDRRVDLGKKKRASLLALVDRAIMGLFESVELFDSSNLGDRRVRRLTWDSHASLCPPPGSKGSVLVIDGRGFPPEGEQSTARWLAHAVEKGWERILTFGWTGGRFAGAGLGAGSNGVRIDLYGDIGDYAASGLDGAELHVHGDGQDQFGQILKSGKLVIHGDVGQTFLYGAKGGEIYVLGSAAGRPLINAVGRPRAVINGACLDYLAESFMAGDPHTGGFVILNGVYWDESGHLQEMETPYPGGNLFSLASGGAIYLRDPRRQVSESQLNGGAFASLDERDWALIEPYLRENERQFGIPVDDLLKIDGKIRSPEAIYRKVVPAGSSVLQEAQNR